MGIDFGLVLSEGAVAGASGTPMFMPPETWPLVPSSVKFTYAFDMYSAGEVIYSLICGQRFHEFIFSQYGNKGDRQISQALQQVHPATYCNARKSLTGIFDLVVNGMLVAANKRAPASYLLKSSVFTGITTLKSPKIVKDQQETLPVIKVPVVPKKVEPTFLDKCHGNKKFWFKYANQCCLKARYVPVRHAYCERPC